MKLARFIVAALLPLTLVTIVQTSTASAVTYGDPIENPQIEFPEVVPVWVGGSSLCSGTLVTQQVVLTAAHCVYGQSGPFQISVGGSTLNNGRLIDVDATWYHPRYDAAFSQNDIALLHLKTPAGVSRLGVLPKPKMKSLGKKFLIVGWGRDQNGMITGKLHQLSLNDQAVASRKFFKSNFNPKTMVGAGRYFADEVLYGGGCTGDSGGPLYQGVAGGSRTILGLTSFGARGCTVYQPTVFTRVDFYVSDIYKGIQLLNSRSSTAPIATGKATPAGIGPTTTTTPRATSTTAPASKTVITNTTVAPTTTTTTTTAPTTTTTRAIAALGIGLGHKVSTLFNRGTNLDIAVSTDASALPSRLCVSVTSNGSAWPWFNIWAGGNWTDAGGGCVSFSGTKGPYNNYYYSPEIQESQGIQSWNATVTVSDSLGRSATSSYSWSS